MIRKVEHPEDPEEDQGNRRDPQRVGMERTHRVEMEQKCDRTADAAARAEMPAQVVERTERVMVMMGIGDRHS